MGQCRSAISYTFIPTESIAGQGAEAAEVLHRLKLSDKEINIFYQAFREIDTTNSGYIRADEFFRQRSLARDDFNMAMFQLFDDQQIKVLDFMEFVCSVRKHLFKLLTFASNLLYT
jgi:Ca2+-binding EF-hand superfamily protein